MDTEDNELDPRIQTELEKLNSATDEINKLEIELDEANTTFRILLNNSTKRLKTLTRKLGSCIEKSRPYFEAVEVAKKAQLECQKAAVEFQRANENHIAAKETVALAEQGFINNKHEWKFDNAWQEMLNHATLKVMEAENYKAESGREHQKRAVLFNAAEQQVIQFEEKLRRNIIKARPYFEEKVIKQEQLNTQKCRIEQLQKQISFTKSTYSQTLKELEKISNEIHMKRKRLDVNVEDDLLNRPREPGVGAELNPTSNPHLEVCPQRHPTLPDITFELDRCEVLSMDSVGTVSSAVSERDETELDDDCLNELKLKVKELATRPVNGGDGQSNDETWESELKLTVDKLDHMMLMQECAQQLNCYKNEQNQKVDVKHESDVVASTNF